MTERRPHIVIIGGGFAGLNVAKGLRKAPVDVTVIDRQNHHLFQPLLYQVATAALSSSDIAVPIRKVLSRQQNARVLLGEVQAIHPEQRTVELEGGTLGYDTLVLATGATHHYFGNEQWAEHAPGLKSIDDALSIRGRVLMAFEEAEREPDSEQQRRWLTFAVIGAGPTGVELAGALAEIARYTLARDFRTFDPRSARIVLMDAAERVLPSFPEELSDKARQKLRDLGVEVRTGARVTRVDEAGVMVGEERIEAHTALWAAGVQASPLARDLGAPLDEVGRVKVTDELRVPGRPEIFVVGDLAAVEQEGREVPGMAAAAIQQGRHVADTILRELFDRQVEPFRYVDKGELAAIGRTSAVANIGRLRFAGFFAWVVWLVVHIFWLIGFRNRLAVMLDWAWAYLTYQRGARVVSRPQDHRPKRRTPKPPPELQPEGSEGA